MLWLLCRYTKCNCLIEKLEGSEVKEGEKVSDFKLTYTCGDQEVSVLVFSFGDPLWTESQTNHPAHQFDCERMVLRFRNGLMTCLVSCKKEIKGRTEEMKHFIYWRHLRMTDTAGSNFIYLPAFIHIFLWFIFNVGTLVYLNVSGFYFGEISHKLISSWSAPAGCLVEDRRTSAAGARFIFSMLKTDLKSSLFVTYLYP